MPKITKLKNHEEKPKRGGVRVPGEGKELGRPRGRTAGQISVTLPNEIIATIEAEATAQGVSAPKIAADIIKSFYKPESTK